MEGVSSIAGFIPSKAVQHFKPLSLAVLRCLTVVESQLISLLLVVIVSKSLSVTFRIPAELVESFTSALNESGTGKTAWLVEAVRQKVGQPESNPDNRMMALVERMETAAAALIGGKQGIPPRPYNESAVIRIVAVTIRDGFDNGRIIAERLNEAGYQTKAGKAWDKDIYSAWKRQGSLADKIAAALQ